MERFVQQYEKWSAMMPHDLARENPAVLIRLLELGTTEHGIALAVLEPQLGIKQSRMSKLIHRLRGYGLVAVNPSEDDGRARFVVTTAEGKSLLVSMESELKPAGKQKTITTSKKSKGLSTGPGFDFNAVEDE